ncbi:MAG: hypothetical protein JNK63_07945 [Chthonomonas sp.]|nr:hypothetical protein [Chthonomonas sp.]
MTVPAVVALLALSQAQPTTKTFVTSDRIFEMQVPKEWTIKKEKTRQTITFSVPDGTAMIEVYGTRYVQPAEDWQALQRTVNEQMKRTIVRQWDEEIMAVPMLFTSLRYSEPKGGDMGALIGLLYTNTAEKFHFRLSAPLASMEAAEGPWRAALLTMRTGSGSAPTTEDGNPDSNVEVKPIAEGRTLSMAATANRPKPMGPVKYAFTTSGRSGVLRFPKGCIVTEGSPTTLEWAGVKGIQLAVYSNDDSPASALFLMQEVNKDLDRYKTVSMRENFGPKRNLVGLDTLTVVRTGFSETGDLQSIAAAGDSGKFYFMIRSDATEAKQFRQHREALLKLVSEIGFEPTP